MKIRHYLYNTFIIEEDDIKIAIDPGGLFLYYFRMTTLIPKSEWDDITHILVTHGDPDHYWHMDRVAEASGAPVICNETMVREVNGRELLLGPRNKGLAFTATVDDLVTLTIGETVEVDGIKVTGLKATHGPLTLKVGPFLKTVTPGPDERVGWGSMGFEIRLNGKTLVNLADTLLHLEEWNHIKNPDVLMIPIGGGAAHNTMDEKEALEAVKMMKPKLVIPCHYSVPALFSKNYGDADDQWFKEEAEKAGIECRIMKSGDEVIL
jgi:L-ascorbate metabolism protein UlaG (beta-lactamase superfamily)